MREASRVLGLLLDPPKLLLDPPKLVYLLDIFRACVIAVGQDDLELKPVGDVENGWPAKGFAGAHQGPVEVGQALPFLLIVGNLSPVPGAQVSYYREVLIVEGDGEMVFANARLRREREVDVDGAPAYQTNRGLLRTMAKQEHEVVGALVEGFVICQCSRVVALPGSIVASDEMRAVLGHEGRKPCALEAFASVWQQPENNIARINLRHRIKAVCGAERSIEWNKGKSPVEAEKKNRDADKKNERR